MERGLGGEVGAPRVPRPSRVSDYRLPRIATTPSASPTSTPTIVTALMTTKCRIRRSTRRIGSTTTRYRRVSRATMAATIAANTPVWIQSAR